MFVETEAAFPAIDMKWFTNYSFDGDKAKQKPQMVDLSDVAPCRTRGASSSSHGKADEDDDELASSSQALDEMQGAAETQAWTKHMVFCNKQVKKVMANFRDVITHAEEGATALTRLQPTLPHTATAVGG